MLRTKRLLPLIGLCLAFLYAPASVFAQSAYRAASIQAQTGMLEPSEAILYYIRGKFEDRADDDRYLAPTLSFFYPRETGRRFCNEFEWPSKRAELVERMRSRLAELPDTVSVTIVANYGEYDFDSQTFPPKEASVDLVRFPVGKPFPGDYCLKGDQGYKLVKRSLSAIKLRFEPSIEIPPLSLAPEAARDFVSSYPRRAVAMVIKATVYAEHDFYLPKKRMLGDDPMMILRLEPKSYALRGITANLAGARVDGVLASGRIAE